MNIGMARSSLYLGLFVSIVTKPLLLVGVSYMNDRWYHATGYPSFIRIQDVLKIFMKQMACQRREYVLAGYSMIGRGHYTCIGIVNLQGKFLHYNGKELRLKEICENDFKDKEGFYECYLR